MTVEKTNRKHRKGIIFLWIFIALFLLIAGASTLLIFNAEKIINENLSDFVFEKTDSIYRLNFEEISIDFGQRSLTISNISLKPDSTSSINSSKTLYQFKTKQIKLNRIKLLPFFRERRFVAEAFVIENPEFNLNTGEKVNLNTLSKKPLQVGDTLKIPVFYEIFFDTVRVVNAQMNIDTLFKSDYKLPEINLIANHFKIGGRKFTSSPYPFDVSDISLSVSNLMENLPDSIHVISVKQIDLSLMHSTIKAKELLLKPISDSIENIENKYTIKVPSVNINCSTISQLYTLDTITFESMEYVNPEIQIKFGNKVKKGTPLNEIDFYKLTGEKLKWILINHFAINNADIKLIPSNDNNVAQQFENLNINFYDWKVDPNSYRNPERILSAKQLSLNISRFTLNHTDNIHQLTIDELELDTRTKSIKTGILKFNPLKGKKNLTNTTISIQSQGIICKDIDFLSFYHKQQLPMSMLLLKSPDVNIHFTKKNTNWKKKDKSLILEKIADYLTGVYVEKTKITNGNISYNYSNIDNEQGFFKTGYNFELENLSVDSVTFYKSDKIFFADNFEVTFTDLSMQLADENHRLLTQSITLSSLNKNAEIIDLQILPIPDIDLSDSLKFSEKLELFDIRFPLIKLSGANLHKAIFEKELFIANFNIYNPTINIEKYGGWKSENENKTPYQNAIYSLVSDFLFNINIQNLNMENGTLNLIQHKIDQPTFELSNLFSIKMKKFELNANSSIHKNKLFFADDIDLVLKNHSFTLADGVHKLTAKEIGILSSQKKVYIKEAKLYPDILSESFKDLPISVFANIPNMQLSNADIFGMINSGKFPVQEMVINKPDIQLLFQKNTKEKPTDDGKQAMLILDDIKLMSASKIKINDGTLKFSFYENYKSNTFATTQVNFEMDNFKVNHQQGSFKTSYTNFAVDFTAFNYKLTDNKHVLNIGKMEYSLKSKLLRIQNLALNPQSKVVQTDKDIYYNLKIPEVNLTSFDFQSYLDNRTITVNTLQFVSPIFKLTDTRIEKKEKFSPYDFDLYPSIKSFAKEFTIEHLFFENGEVEFKNDQPVHLKNINFNATHFKIDEANSQNNKLFKSDLVNVKIQHLNGKTKKGFYQYNIDAIRFNNEGDFSINGISLTPLYTQKDFARMKVYQDDYFELERVDIRGKGLKMKSFIEEKNFVVKKLEINFKNPKIHRDKTFPLQPGLHKNLPQEALRDLKTKIAIDSALFIINDFQYTEFEPNATRKSSISVTDASALITNITNMKDKLLYNPNMLTEIHGKLMGVSDVKVEMDMNLKSLGNEYSFMAECDALPLNTLNPIIEPGLKISVKEGMNQKLEVYFQANEDSAVGSIKFEYSDLKISVLNTRSGEIREDKFVSFLVNSMALKTDNPKPGRLLIPTKFKNYRDKERSIVGYNWQSIYAGIKATLGIKDKEEQ